MTLISKLLPFASKSLPVALGLKGMSKIDPRIQRFIGYATSAGFGSDQIMDYIRSKLENPQDQATRSQMESDEAQGRLRPDERANLSMIRDSQRPKDIAQGAASLAIGGLGGLLGSDVVDEKEAQENQQPMDTQEQHVVNPILNDSGFPVLPKKEAVSQPEKQPKPQITDELWNRVQEGKVKVTNPDVTEFLKASHSLYKMRGLKDKSVFDGLWDEFQQLVSSGMDGKKAADQIMMSYNKSLHNQAKAPQEMDAGQQQILESINALRASRERRGR